jgi:hypothetical protein
MFGFSQTRKMKKGKSRGISKGGGRLIENLEDRRMMAAHLTRIDVPAATSAGPSIESFSLVSAKDDSVIRPIHDGDVVDLSLLGLRRKDVNVRANFASSTDLESVKWDISGATTYHHVEEHIGYYLFGGKGANVGSNNNKLMLGRNVVTAAAYTQDFAHGTAGASQTFTFDLITSGAGVGSGVGSGPGFGQLEKVMVVNTATGQNIVQLDGYNQVVHLGTISPSTLNVVATPNSTVGSVTFQLNGQTIVSESTSPYALFGDINGTLSAGAFQSGLNTLTLFPYSGTGGTGTPGPIVMFSFTIGA